MPRDDDDDEAIPDDVALLGTVVTSALLAVVSVRVLAFFRESFTAWHVMTPRKVFHVLLWAAVALELPVYVEGLRSGQQSRGPYACHLVALAAFMASFSVVVLVWRRTLYLGYTAGPQAAASDPLLRVLCGLNGSYFVVTVVAVVRLLLHPSDGLDEWTDHDPLYPTLQLFDSFLLLFNALGLLSYGLQLQLKLMRHPSWRPLATAHRRAILAKLNTTMFGCATVYLLRVGLVLMLFAGVADSDVPLLTWYIFCQWVPSVVPTLLFLFMMRRPDDQAMAEAADRDPAPPSPLVQAQRPLLDPNSSDVSSVGSRFESLDGTV